MGRIRILSDSVANKIAAGEVVERPASVVKELLENSLDAGAKTLRIEVERGGRRLIRVTDDGVGMIRDDALLAFERHATSKLSDAKDLLSISTLGFRGEALPSIASVSRLTLETRSQSETTGTKIEIAGGKLLRCDEAALAQGTVITVRDLFFNLPARKKFLRTEQTELSHVAQLATHYSLARPDKSIQLLNGGKSMLDVTPVDSLRDRVFQVFGSQLLRDLVELEEKERKITLPPDYRIPDSEGETRLFRLRGFVSQPQVQKSNRNSVYVFVNGRLVRDRTILHAISKAYQNLIPPSTYPFALMFLDCDYEEVDVNVHPSKTEVRFRRGSLVHNFVSEAIRETLVATRPVSSVPVQAFTQPGSRPPSGQPAGRLPYSEFTQSVEDHAFGQPVSEPPRAAPMPPPPPDEELPEFTLHRDAGRPQRFDYTEADPAAKNPPSAGLRLKVPDTHGPLPEGLLAAEEDTLAALPDLRPLGQLHDSFIIAAGRDGLWILDQHVIHERILFEKVLRQQAAGRLETQRLLTPLVVELTAAQLVEYERIADELNQMGIESEPFGAKTVAVKSAPAGVSAGQVEKLVFEILEIADQEARNVSFDEMRRAMAASIACRAAIKINTPLDETKMRWLLAELAKTDCPMSCPHGRPIALRYATRDILRGFHRV